MWFGRLGTTVRCVPWRRTLMGSSGSTTLYAKVYHGRGGAAAREWRWLRELPQLGILAPQPVIWLAERRTAMIVTSAVAGRSLDAWAADAAEQGWLEAVFGYACSVVASFARQLHGQGLIHRDLNCAHLYSDDPRAGGAVTVIDVERVFRPRLRWRRWVVKELASLLASAPVKVPVRVQLRFLRCYAPDASRAERHSLARSVARKALRITRHQPRFG